VGAVSGAEKHTALQASLKAALVTVLVTDAAMAQRLLGD
jgi:DNA-binding transcriptional regulator LsrR (DeoR family)